MSLFSHPRRSRVAPSKLSKNSPKTPPAKADEKREQIATHRISSDKCDNSGRGYSRERSAETDGPVGAGRRFAQRGDHARRGAEHLSQFGGDGIGRRLGKRRQSDNNERHGHDGGASRTSLYPSAGTGINPFDTRAAMPRLAATCDASRPRRFSAMLSRSFCARPSRVARWASRETASTGSSAVCHGS